MYSYAMGASVEQESAKSPRKIEIRVDVLVSAVVSLIVGLIAGLSTVWATRVGIEDQQKGRQEQRNERIAAEQWERASDFRIFELQSRVTFQDLGDVTWCGNYVEGLKKQARSAAATLPSGAYAQGLGTVVPVMRLTIPDPPPLQRGCR